MSIFMVERELTSNCMAALTERHPAILDKAPNADTWYLRSLFLPLRGGFFCFFEGPDAEAVRKMNDDAKLPYKAIMPAGESVLYYQAP